METLRAQAHADLVALADVVLGAGPRDEVALLDVGQGGRGSADVVWAGVDDVSRLHSTGELAAAVRAAQVRLRAGGLVLLPAPEPAELKLLHAVAPVAVQLAADGSAGPIRLWDFSSGVQRSYSSHQLRLRRTEDGWAVEVEAPIWHEVPTELELRAVLGEAGFRGAQRLSAAESGLPCAVWAAVAPSEAAPSEAAPSGPAPG